MSRDDFSTTTSQGGEFHTKTFPEPVNFKADDGSWSPINRTLESVGDGTVRPKYVDGDAAIPSTLADPVRLEHDGRHFSFELLGADGGRDTTGSDASFDDAVPNANITYGARSNGLKETIELENASARRVYNYAITGGDDLTASIDSGGELVLVDGAGNEKFRVSAPLAWDSAPDKAYSNALNLSVTKQSAGHWTLTMRPDAKWLDDPARVYPVTLDPDVYWLNDGTGAERFHGANQDCYLSGIQQAGTSYCAATTLALGYYNRPYRPNLRFDVASAIPAYANITNAQLDMYLPGTSTHSMISSRVKTLTSDWDNTATWNNRKVTSTTSTPWTTAGGDVSTDPNLTGTANTVVGNAGYWYYWNVPNPAVSGWIKGTLPNYGLQVRADSEVSATNAYSFVSTDGNQASWPALDVTWVPDTIAPTPITATGTGSADQTYLGGAATGTIAATATDENSGIRTLDLLRDGTQVAVAGVACPSNTCPLTTTSNLPYNTTSWTEGAHTLQVRAYDDAGNISTSAPWTVYVDRTAPTLSAGAAADAIESNLSLVSWDSDDPDLPGVRDGSGAASDAIRFRDASGNWSAWAAADGDAETARSGPLTIQLRLTDVVGNVAELAPVTIAIDNPDLSGDLVDAEDPADNNCTSVYSSTYCTEAGQDDPQQAAAFALATPTAPAWGLADADAAYLNYKPANPITNTPAVGVPNSYLQSPIVGDLSEGALNHVRLLVAYNIFERKSPDNSWRYPRRRAAFIKAVNAAAAKANNILVSFEAGCDTDNDNMACSGQVGTPQNPGPMLTKRWPASTAVNTAIKRLYLSVSDAVGEKVRWIGIWNEPTNATQPFSQAGGFARLKKLTEQITNPATTSCKVYKCRFVTPEVEILAPPLSTPRLTYSYASWLRTFKRTKPDNAKRIAYYGAHDYSEVFHSSEKPNPDASKSRLAKWMGRLPTDAKVWLPEIGVSAETASNETADETARGKQADYLFNKLSRVRTSKNGATISKASYYSICPAPLVGFDTSVHVERPAVPAGSSNCTEGATLRPEIVTPLDAAID